MSKASRHCSCFGQGDEVPDLHILVVGRDKPLTAHWDMLKYNSGVVRELPRAASGEPTTWDLRGVVLEGESQPVSAHVVDTWLDVIYSRVDASRSGAPPSCLQECVRLLKFADFSQTCIPVLRDIAAKFADDRGAYVGAPHSEQLRPRLMLRDTVFVKGPRGLVETSLLKDINGTSEVVVPADVLDLPRLRAAATDALESALYLAARLELSPLITLLRSFIKAQLLPYRCNAVVDFTAVYSPRVLHALPREVLYEGFLRDSLADPAACVELTTTGPDGELQGVFRTGLAAKWFGRTAGERVEGGLRLEPRRGPSVALKAEGVVTEARVTTLLGGLQPEEREAMVRESMAAAKAAAGGGPVPGADGTGPRAAG